MSADLAPKRIQQEDLEVVRAAEAGVRRAEAELRAAQASLKAAQMFRRVVELEARIRAGVSLEAGVNWASGDVKEPAPK